ncbi:MAG TPA: FAD-dependent oxidoreductase [Bradyrhizobium sp.]|jgi:thioredoxin reductase (NADPH)|nr:FAD-dependent oxidoreductase [Bradyrhizobium sp.]
MATAIGAGNGSNVGVGPGRVFPRLEQTFPSLTEAEIARMRRFGELRAYKQGELLFETGKPGPGMFVVLSGHVAITERDGLGHIAPIIDQGPGQFLAEVGQLSGRVALVDGHAEGDVETLLIPPDKLRALLVAEADLGERIMRALILRRVSLIQGGVGGPVLIGPSNSASVARLQNFLTRNSFPHHLLDPERDHDAAEIIARYSPSPSDWPLVVMIDGTVLRNPSENEAARALGMIGGPRGDRIYDAAIVGCGPAGLATAVYAASEGLSVVMLDSRAYGGQAGASARIENYLGFPTGISGQALAGRAFSQAQKFGAEIMIPVSAKSLNCERRDGAFALALESGEELRARSVVVASGALYRRPDIENLDKFEGRGVWYWASPVEARLCAEQEVMLVGGGNSAGQAAVFLSGHARKVTMVIRGGGLGASMSRYLIERIEATPNIELMFNAEIVALEGREDASLGRVRWKSRLSTEIYTSDIRNLFLFVGADPATNWLDGCGVTLDRGGFVVTGAQSELNLRRQISALETSVPGVFAVGDVRSGSVKRVGGAIGEGAQVVAALHSYLGDVAKPAL